MKNALIVLTVLTLTAKIILLFVVNKDLAMNTDEKRNYDLAFNHQNGKGYTCLYPWEKAPKLSAFHASFPVFVYEFFIKSGIKIQVWVTLVYALAIILFAISISYFYRLSLFFLMNERYALFATVTYCLYPSMLFYVGPLFLYENLALPVLVIVIYKFIVSIKSGFSRADYFWIPVMISLSSLFRPQTILIYALIFAVYGLIILKSKNYRLISVFLLSIILAGVVQIPALVKNKKMFGEYTLSTQAGFELLQGHNPLARGSWVNNSEFPGNPIYIYSHSKIANLGKMNELEESKARKQLAIQWIKENPLSEIKLCFRKLAIYFIPKNFEVLKTSDILNPVNLLVHLLFLSCIALLLYKWSFTKEEMLLFSPIAGSIILTLIFFVGYRWRYYAEPFMIIFAWQFLLILSDKFKKKGGYAPISSTSV